MHKAVLFLLLQLIVIFSQAQYAPAADEEGTTAIHKDSSIIKAWVSDCRVQRGYIDIEDTTKEDNDTNRASFGADTNVLGYPSGNMDVVSLGDGGTALVRFDGIIYNAQGPDFAVFENGFKKDTNNYFLELAFVEVSSDSVHFVRFPSVSLIQTDTQIGGFEGIDPKKIHNLAGKYVNDYGTPFDLDDLKDSANIDINNIRFIRLVDVVGDIHNGYATYDSQGHKINEPWSTAFKSGGFDLNAVGAIHIHLYNEVDDKSLCPGKIYPNPVSVDGIVKLDGFGEQNEVAIYTLTGRCIWENKNVTSLNVRKQIGRQGVFVVKIKHGKRFFTQRIIVIQ